MPFLEQRSPGYPMAALGPYWLQSTLVEPLVQTQKVVDRSPGQDAVARPPSRNSPSLPSSGEGQGSEFVLIPPVPLLLKDVPFQDYYVPAEASWYQ
jgi:hypothetical protein